MKPTTRSPLRLGFLLSTLISFALSSTLRAVDPPPDGGYANYNTAEGEDALFSLTTGDGNTAIGYRSLYYTTTGVENTAIGYQSLLTNTTGINNTAAGYQALFRNTTGSSNTASGNAALWANTTGDQNTATGDIALGNNTTGRGNLADGEGALLLNTTGNNNVSSGWNSMYRNTTGSNNTADGTFALQSNTTGNNNIALGYWAATNLTTGDNNIDIDNAGVAGEAGAIRIGTAGTQTATFIAGIRGTPITGGVAVGISPDGQLGIRASSVRFKEAIKPMDRASEAILSLHPVSFRYRKELDPKSEPQFGLIAEEVAKVDPDLVVTDEKGQSFSVRYEEVNAMLLNEFLKEHRKVEEQEATITQLKSAVEQQQEDSKMTTARQQKEIQALTARLNLQESRLRKVSEHLEMSQQAPQVAVDNQ